MISGSSDFAVTRSDIVSEAFDLANLTQTGETRSAEDDASAVRTLEIMVKAWQAQGYHLWGLGEATLLVTKGQAKYGLGPSSTDHVAETVASTTLSAAASTSDGTITVASISGITDGDNIGVALDSGAFHWTTVNGAPSGSTVTLTVAMPSAAASGNAVYAYTSLIRRPLRLENVRVAVSSTTEVPITQWSREEYFTQPNKTPQGVPTQWYYDPQLTTGNLYLWPTPSTIDYLVHFTYERPIQDFDAPANEPYFPIEWAEALSANLAYRMALKHGVPGDIRAEIKLMADIALDNVLSWDREDAPVLIQPEF